MNGLRGLAWLLLFQAAGEAVSHGLRLPVPGPVLGLLLCFAALSWPGLRAAVGACADFLLAHLSLLFVPVGVGVVAHLALLQAYGWRIALVVVLSTWAGLAVTSALLWRLLRDAGGEGEGEGARDG